MALRITTTALLLTLALVGCSDADDDRVESSPTATTTSASTASPQAETSAKGTKLVVRESEFGRMLFNAQRQAIYIFDNDTRKKSNCYGECAAAWPPVSAKGGPVAGKGVRDELLGTTTRRSGKKQVTYGASPSTTTWAETARSCATTSS